MKTDQRVARGWLGWFLGWALVGIGWALGVIAVLSVGFVLIVAATVGAVLLARRSESRIGLPGLLAGPSIGLLALAIVNRAGPGTVCTGGLPGSLRRPGDPPVACTEYWNPYVLGAGAAALLGLAVVLQFLVVSRRRAARDDAPGGMQPGLTR